MNDLTEKHCKPCEGGVLPLNPKAADALLAGLDGWVREEAEISKTFTFKNYYETMAFVNDGLSENDFICASKLNALTR